MPGFQCAVEATLHADPPETGRAGKSGARSRWRLIFGLMAISHLFGFASSIDALMSTRSPQGAVAWIVSLNTFPYVSVPAYWVFGRTKFHGYVIARRDEESSLAGALAGAISEITSHRSSNTNANGPYAGVERLAKWPFLQGNRLDLLIDGEATYGSLLAGIESAERYILLQSYIVRADALGNTVRERLIAKAKEGVEVYFLYDEIGSYQFAASHYGKVKDGQSEECTGPDGSFGKRSVRLARRFACPGKRLGGCFFIRARW